MKEENGIGGGGGIQCTVCGADADGMHYGAMSCRSCNAFFRRAVTFKQTYVCRKDGDCDVNQYVRCACRACRFSKCLRAGMKVVAVQPRRDPTGSQKNRRPPKRKRFNTDNGMNGMENSPDAVQSLLQFIKSEPPNSVESYNDDEPSVSGSSNCDAQATLGMKQDFVEHETRFRLNLEETLLNDDGEEFDRLVLSYTEHQRLMNRAMISIDDFLAESESGVKFRKMTPHDVEKLSTVELSGLLYWIEKLHPYKFLDMKDRDTLLKRYSVKKLSLDHFYYASKFPNLIEHGNFAMLNNTYVPPTETGFEGVNDDEKTKRAKYDIFRPTLDRLWHTIILPFARLKVTDAEIVTLHMLLLWSQQNNRCVSEKTKDIMRKRREWAVARLFEQYEQIGLKEPMVRLGEIILLLPEIEEVINLHTSDFQVAKLFQFCDMSGYWYERLCYSNEDQE